MKLPGDPSLMISLPTAPVSLAELKAQARKKKKTEWQSENKKIKKEKVEIGEAAITLHSVGGHGGHRF